MKVGDVVIDKFSKTKGVVAKVVPGVDVENHGFIHIVVTDPGKSNYLTIGDEEHYVHYNWQNFLKVCE